MHALAARMSTSDTVISLFSDVDNERTPHIFAGFDRDTFDLIIQKQKKERVAWTNP